MLLEMFNGFIIFGLLLLAGVIVRELVPPLQKALLPASLIGGFIGLILGPQLLGLIDIPVWFGDLPGIGMRIIMTCVPLGIAVSFRKLSNHLDFAFANMASFGFQMTFGIILGSILMKFWPALPEGWGLVAVSSFFGSHGSVPVSASIMDPTGALGVQDMGMILATFGILVAIIVGMIIANYGARRGWAKFTKNLEAQPNWYFRGTLPEDKRVSIGKTVVNPSNVSAIALQFAIISVTYKFGEILFKYLIMVIPFFGKVAPILWGLVGGMILWPVMQKLKLDRFVDKDILNQITNWTLEVVIVGAIATISVAVVGQFIVPLVIFTVIILGIVGLFIFTWMKYIGNDQWFEKALMAFGMECGNNPQGHAIVRSIDPNNVSVIFEALAVYNGIFFWNYLLVPFAATMVNINRVPIYAIGAGLMLLPVAGTIYYKKMRKSDSLS